MASSKIEFNRSAEKDLRRLAKEHLPRSLEEIRLIEKTFTAANSMSKLALALVAGLALTLTGCTTYDVGSSQLAEPNGSYAGGTLNSPVTDQNPYIGGGDTSYPTTTDSGQPPPPPGKLDGR